MYTVGIRQEFVAKHFLLSGSGREALPHPHGYRLELFLEGERLDGNGYLADIDELKMALKGILSRYRGRVLNELPEFSGLNPSLEHLSRIVCRHLREPFRRYGITAITVRIWEDGAAWAGYREET